MKIEAAKGFAVCIATHVVKAKGRIVFRGTEAECLAHVQLQADIDANYSTTVWSPCVTAIGTDHDGVEFD